MNYESWIMSTSLLSYPFLIKHNRFIVYLINGNFLLQYTIYIIYRFLFLYYILYWQSFKDQLLHFFRKRVQNYCFFATWPNFLEDFLNYLRNSLIFSTHFLSSQPQFFSTSQNTPSFFAKAGAKVLLFYDITKSLCKIFIFSS